MRFLNSISPFFQNSAQPTVLTSQATPIFFHAPGYFYALRFDDPEKIYRQQNPLWDPITSYWQDRSTIENRYHQDAEDLTIITVSTAEHETILEQSLSRYECNTVVLRPEYKNDPWINAKKIEIVLSALEKITTQYVLFADAFDVLCVNHPAMLVKTFRTLSYEMVFNAQVHFFPDIAVYQEESDRPYCTSIWKEFERSLSDSVWRYLNSGLWIANTEFARTFLEVCYKLRETNLQSLASNWLAVENYNPTAPPLSHSDQFYMHWAFSKLYPQVGLDWSCQMFCCLRDIPDDLMHVSIPRAPWDTPLSSYRLAVKRVLKELKLRSQFKGLPATSYQGDVNGS
jgi:hypothetical protein